MESSNISKVKKFVNQHLKNEFSLNASAEDVGYSAFHLAREFKNQTKYSIMEYARTERVLAASKELEKGFNVCDVAMEYCFETHTGFTKAFTAVFGCTPRQYQHHIHKMNTIKREMRIMKNSKTIIRHICKDDV